MAKVFISYRRQDSLYPARQLHGALKPYVDDPKTDIFIDIDNIPAGVDFVAYLDGKVAECDVLLAVIGEGWMDARNPATGARRLDDPHDFVRVEISSALKRGIPVVPVLLDGAPIPKAEALPEDLRLLPRRNGVEVRHSSFESDVARLVDRLPVPLKDTPLETAPPAAAEPKIVTPSTPPAPQKIRPQTEQTSPARPKWLPAALVGAVALVVASVVATQMMNAPRDNEAGRAAEIAAEAAEIAAPAVSAEALEATDLGRTAFAANDYATARAHFEAGCEGGDPAGCNNLGTIYEQGFDGSQDYAKARDLFQKACDDVEMMGCVNLGVLYQAGQGVTQSFDQAHRLYERACSNGEMMGCNNLGILYDQGLGVTQDYVEARRLYTKACDNREIQGCSHLGELLYTGKGGAADEAEGLRLLRDGCFGGHQWACNWLNERGLPR